MMIRITMLILALPIVLNYSCAKDVFPQKEGLYALMKTSKGNIMLELFEAKTPLTVSNFVGLAQGTKEWKDPKTGEMVKRPFYKNLTFHRVIENFMIQGGCPLGNGMGGPGYQFEDECFEKIEISGIVSNDEMASAIWADIFAPYIRQHQGPNGPSEFLNKKYQEVMDAKDFKPLYSEDIELYIKESELDSRPYSRGDLIHEVEYGNLCMANSGPNSNGSQFFIVSKKEGTPWLNGKHTVFGRVISGMDVVNAIENTETDANDKPLKPIIIKEIVIKRV